MAPVRPVLQRLSCSTETVRNAPKLEFWVQWSGSGAAVAKNSDATLFRVCLVQRSQPAFAVGTSKAEPNALRLRVAFPNAAAFLR
jgi:hypothetical protein